MSFALVTSLKEIGMPIAIISSIVGAGVGYGKLSTQVDNTLQVVVEEKVERKEVVDEIKKEIREKRDMDMQQSILIQKVSTQLESNTKLIEKIEKKLDK
ncbi:unnamed protein product [marine sediment metagenome]|uniref:Uncharacterized protein n=1 Tax=marine sediment metagenome TaxID=412755 RepID=X0TGI0_9ZZZZ